MEVIGYLATLIMGLTLGLMGGGGSILTVPILVYLFAVPPVTATAYSLFIVGLTSLIGFVSFFRKGEVNLKVGIIFAVPGFLGVFVARSYIVPSLPSEIFKMGSFALTKDLLIMLSFAVLMIVASFSMIRKKKKTSDKPNKPKAQWLIGVEGLVVGVITGFVGAGGGFLIIPALVVLGGLPMKVAVGTSLMIIAFKSLLGFTGDLLHATEPMNWSLLLALSVISVVGILLGSAISKYFSEQKLKFSFGIFVLLMGIVILGQNILAST